MILKVNKTKSWFFEKINKIKKKRKKNQINKILSEKGAVTTDKAEIQRIIRDYNEQLYGNKMDKLEEIDRLLEQFDLPRLNQEEIEIMSNLITSTENETVIKNSKKQTNKQKKTTHKSPGPDGFRREFYQTFSEELVSILLKLFLKIPEEGTFPNSFSKATIIMIPKPDKDKCLQKIKTT